jgi:hypothetical protein
MTGAEFKQHRTETRSLTKGSRRNLRRLIPGGPRVGTSMLSFGGAKVRVMDHAACVWITSTHATPGLAASRHYGAQPRCYEDAPSPTAHHGRL